MSLTKQTRLNLESLDDRTVPAVLDLTGAGSFGSVNGAIVHHMDGIWASTNGDQSHGTGALQAVLGVNHTGTETGYNTTATTLQTGMDTTLSQALTLGQVPVVTVNGNQYYEFVMNVNEPTGAKARKLTVNELQFFASNVSNLTNYNANMDTLGSGANKVSARYNLTAGDPTNSLLLRAKTNTTAVGEIAFLVPVGNFAGASPSSFVYIYTKITGAAGGDEQWGVRQGPQAPPSGPVTLSGHVFKDMADVNGVFNGTFDAGEGLSGVTLVFSGPDGDQFYTTTVDDDGAFTFNGSGGGSYQVAIWQNGGHTPSGIVVGDANGNGTNTDSVDGTAAGFETILDITLAGGANATGYSFLMDGPLT